MSTEIFECDVCGKEFDNVKSKAAHMGHGHDEPWMSEDKLRKEYIENERSAREIAEEWGCDKTTIYNWLEKFGYERREAKDYNRVERVYYKTRKEGYEHWQLHYGADRGKQIMVHRLAAVAWHGLDAIQGNHVHHKNGVKWDNREENLEFMTPTQHIKHHQHKGDVPVGPEAQRKGGYNPEGLFVGVPNEERKERMTEELQNDL